MKLDLIPWPVNCAVIVGTPLFATIAEYLQWINPLMQFVAYLLAILWGAFQIWIAYRSRAWRRS